MIAPSLFTPRVGLAVARTLSVVLLFSGCVSSKYKSAGQDSRPPVALNLTAAPVPNDSGQPPVEVIVHSIIAFHGPGSWKRHAYWDEYVLTIRSGSATMISVDSATLMDFQGIATSLGTNPWKLDKQSHDYESSVLATNGPILEIGNGAKAAPAGALVVGATVVGGYYGAAAVGMTIVATPFALPVYAAGALFLNSNRKHHIEDEFGRRRLKLPLMLVPGQVVQGSLFFRITPGPQQLMLQCRVDNEPREVVINLAPLAGLHLKSPPPAGAPSPGLPSLN